MRLPELPKWGRWYVIHQEKGYVFGPYYSRTRAEDASSDLNERLMMMGRESAFISVSKGWLRILTRGMK